MIHSLSIRFYLNQFKARGKKLPVYLRITVDRKKSEVATSYFLEPKEWDPAMQRTKKNKPINEDLSNIESQVHSISKRLEKENKSFSANSIKNFLTRKDNLDMGIVEFYQSFLERLERAGEVDMVTVKMYGYTKTYIQNFLKEKKRTEDVLLENVDFRFLSDFDLFLLDQKVNGADKRLERNTVNKHHSRLRTILIRALKENYITKNPYTDFKLKSTPSKRTFLTQDELQKIIDHKLGENESLQRVRDIFIFSVYTGLRFEDAQQLTMDRIIKDKKGTHSLQIRQEKTDEPLSIPILKPALDIIKKYEGSDERKVLKRVLPKITNQKLNAYLKTIADLAGIEKNLTHHMARHTCATTILLSNEVPIEVVSKWLGHTNIKTTQIYAKITNDYLHQVARKIEDKISTPKRRKK